jgi:hypothetical protein
MPFIIETRRTSTTWAGGIVPVPAETTRQAVATLEEARGVLSPVLDSLAHDRGAYWPAWTQTFHGLGEETGGTIGPLPDGTIIEVRRVAEVDLRDSFPADSCAAQLAHLADVIDAFNADASAA